MKTFTMVTVGLSLCWSSLGIASSEIVCRTAVTSDEGQHFVYSVRTTGSQAGDGSIATDSDLRLYLAIDGQTVVDGDQLSYVEAGMGHQYYTLSSSIYGLTVDFSSLGASIAVRHTVAEGEELYAPRGACRIAEKAAASGYRCSIYDRNSTSGPAERQFTTDIQDLDIVVEYCKEWMRQEFAYPRNFRVDWVEKTPFSPETEMTCGGIIEALEDGFIWYDSSYGDLQLDGLSASDEQLLLQPRDPLPACVVGTVVDDTVLVEFFGFNAL